MGNLYLEFLIFPMGKVYEYIQGHVMTTDNMDGIFIFCGSISAFRCTRSCLSFFPPACQLEIEISFDIFRAVAHAKRFKDIVADHFRETSASFQEYIRVICSSRYYGAPPLAGDNDLVLLEKEIGP